MAYVSASLLNVDAIGPRSKGGATMVAVMEGDTRKLEEAVAKGEGRTTLKMRRDGQAVVEQVVCGRRERGREGEGRRDPSSCMLGQRWEDGEGWAGYEEEGRCRTPS